MPALALLANSLGCATRWWHNRCCRPAQAKRDKIRPFLAAKDAVQTNLLAVVTKFVTEVRNLVTPSITVIVYRRKFNALKCFEHF